MAEKKIEEWMRDAAAKIGGKTDKREYYEKQISEIIADAYANRPVSAETEETVRAEFEKWKKSLPKCAETCDGDLVGCAHDADCPVGMAGGFATFYDAFKAGRNSVSASSATESERDVWICETCGSTFSEYTNGCPHCWDAGIRSGVRNKRPEDLTEVERELIAAHRERHATEGQ